MAEYHVGCGAFGIYAGTLNNKNKSIWQNKTECTDEAMMVFLPQESGKLSSKKIWPIWGNTVQRLS